MRIRAAVSPRMWKTGESPASNTDTAARVLGAFTEGIHYYKTHPENGIAALRSRRGDAQTAKGSIKKWRIPTARGPIRI